ncbi:MAG: glycosyltransferase [Woeseiaceae bacterium]|nr:glycosyltransferase [Woeseiaceae bacterium]
MNDIDVVIPVSGRCDSLPELHAEYASAIRDADRDPRFIYVLDGEQTGARNQLDKMLADGVELTIIQLGRNFGEATALTAGFEESTTDVVLTLPAYYQVEPSSLSLLLEDSSDVDIKIGRRWPRQDSKMNRGLTSLFHRTVRALTGDDYKDLGCGVRLLTRKLIDEVTVYGDQHRFLPILASRRGFRTVEIDLPQSQKETFRRVPDLGVYPRRLLDLLSVFFLVKFTKKPLRFFGLLGGATLSVGAVSLLVVVVQRLLFSVPLADRPALLVASLLAVLGVQLLAIGLVGEIVIFTHASSLKEYTIREIVNPHESHESLTA